METTTISIAITLYAIPTSIALLILFKLGGILEELSRMRAIIHNDAIGKHLEDMKGQIQRTGIKLCNSIDYHGKPKDNEPKDNEPKDNERKTNKWKLD